jgi:hypothetical protein
MARCSHCFGLVGNPAQVRTVGDLDHFLILTSGKSVMCSYIINDLSDSLDVNLCYYVCSSHDIRNTSLQVMRVIAIQLLRRLPDLASLIANSYVYQGSSCGMLQLRKLLPQLLEISPRTRIVIDGLDECPTDIQNSLMKDLSAICLGAQICCKLLFSSRREGLIYEKLSGKPQIILDGKQEVESDIRSFVKHRIKKLRTQDEALLKNIESILVEKANGKPLMDVLISKCSP